MITNDKLVKFTKKAKNMVRAVKLRKIPTSIIMDWLMNLVDRINKLAYVDEKERAEAIAFVWTCYEKALKVAEKSNDETWGNAKYGVDEDGSGSYSTKYATDGNEVTSYGLDLESVVGAEMYGNAAKGVTGIKRNKDDE